VILVTLGLKFFARGMLSVSAVLLGILAGYLYALAMGMLDFAAIAGSWQRASAFALPQPFKYGFEFSLPRSSASA
jgi:xanthine/uracil permease